MTQYNTSSERTFPFSNMAVQLALAANTELTYTIPGDNSATYRCEFSYAYNANVWVGFNATSTTPVAGTVAESPNVELNPEVRFVRGADVLHFKSNATVTDAGFSLLRLPG